MYPFQCHGYFNQPCIIGCHNMSIDKPKTASRFDPVGLTLIVPDSFVRKKVNNVSKVDNCTNNFGKGSIILLLLLAFITAAIAYIH